MKVPHLPCKQLDLHVTPMTMLNGKNTVFTNSIFMLNTLTFKMCFFFHQLDSPPLSPLPVMRNQAHSPRRKVSTRHPVYISPHKNGIVPLLLNGHGHFIFILVVLGSH